MLVMVALEDDLGVEGDEGDHGPPPPRPPAPAPTPRPGPALLQRLGAGTHEPERVTHGPLHNQIQIGTFSYGPLTQKFTSGVMEQKDRNAENITFAMAR